MTCVRPLLLLVAVVILTGGCAFVRGTYGEEVKPLDLSSIKGKRRHEQRLRTFLGAPKESWR
jgi:hypothetical protein